MKREVKEAVNAPRTLTKKERNCKENNDVTSLATTKDEGEVEVFHEGGSRVSGGK